MSKTAEILKAAGIPYKYYPNTNLLNLTDKLGTVHSFYRTTKTCIYRASNAYRAKTVVVRDSDMDTFIDSVINAPTKIYPLFGDD